MKNLTFVVDTKDTRMFYLLRYMQDLGYACYALDSYSPKTGVVYCFSPATRFSAEQIYVLAEGSILIAGKISQEYIHILREKNITYKNILQDEIFDIENAVQTAEAALMLIIRASNLSLYDMNVAIFGYGRVGKALAQLFRSIGIKFSVYTADYYEQASAKLCHCDIYDLSASPCEADVIVNTIPAKILSLDKLQKAKNSCYILDLASSPSCDNSDITALGLIYDNALGLPGKYSPKSAGKILAEAILRLDEVKLC